MRPTPPESLRDAFERKAASSYPETELWDGLAEWIQQGNLSKRDFLTADRGGLTPLHFFIREGRLEEAADLLGKKGDRFLKADFMEPKDRSTAPLQWAAHYGQLEALDRVLARGGEKLMADDIFYYDQYTTGVVGLAAESGQLLTVERILAASGKGLTKDDFIGSPSTLHYAAKSGHLDQVVQILAPRGEKITHQDVVAPNQLKNTLLHEAADGGHLAQVEEILAAQGEKLTREDFHLTNRGGEMPLHRAALNGQLLEVARILEANGERLQREDFLVSDDDNQSVFLLATRSGHIDQLVATVKNVGALYKRVLFKADKERKTPLHYAAELGEVAQIDTILTQNGEQLDVEDFRAKNDASVTPIHLAKPGTLREIAGILRAKGGEQLTKADLLDTNFMCESRLYLCFISDTLDDALEVLTYSGERITKEDFVGEDADGHSLIKLMADAGNCDPEFIFHEKLWVGRMSEMTDFWNAIPPQIRDKFDEVDFDFSRTRQRVMQLTMAAVRPRLPMNEGPAGDLKSGVTPLTEPPSPPAKPAGK